MEEITFTPSKSLSFIKFFLFQAFVIIGIFYYLYVGEEKLNFLSGFFLLLFFLSSFVFLIPIFSSDKVYLKINSEGIYEHNIGKEIYYSWDEVENFTVINTRYLNKFVGFNCLNEEKAKVMIYQTWMSALRKNNFNCAFVENYGKSPKDLVQILNSYKSNSAK